MVRARSSAPAGIAPCGPDWSEEPPAPGPTPCQFSTCVPAPGVPPSRSDESPGIGRTRRPLWQIPRKPDQLPDRGQHGGLATLRRATLPLRDGDPPRRTYESPPAGKTDGMSAEEGGPDKSGEDVTNGARQRSSAEPVFRRILAAGAAAIASV